MSATPPRNVLLRARLRGFTRTLPRAKSGEARVTERAWEAARRLRELLPVLPSDVVTAGKLSPRLRRVTRRLAKVRQLSAVLAVLDDVAHGERRTQQPASRVRDDVGRLAEAAHTELFRRRIGNDVRRVTEKLDALSKVLAADAEDMRDASAAQSIARARVARRAIGLKQAINAAGAVYLPGRLSEVGSALRKLRYAAELALELGGGILLADLRVLTRVQAVLTRLDTLQQAIARARYVQGSLATPDLKAWHDLDRLVNAFENRCRGPHARYVRERSALVALCDRMVGRAPTVRIAKRKVS